MNASSKAAALNPSIASRANFDPPPTGGKGRAFTLALLAHLLLVLALAWGLHWKKDAQDMAVEAELWSATVQTATPRAAHVQPPPPPTPAVPPRPVPKPEPKPVPQVQDDSEREAELALEQQKKREQAQQRQEQEQERKAEQARLQAQQRQEQEQQRQAAAQQAATVKAAQQQAQAEQAKAADAARRQAILRNLRAQASADQTGMANTPISGQGKTPGGNAKYDAGPSTGYNARVIARVKPNIVYPDLRDISGNPRAEVQVNLSPDGTILDRHLSKSSGVPSWDNAVLRAIDKTQTLPRDVDGRVPSSIIIGFRPND